MVSGSLYGGAEKREVKVFRFVTADSIEEKVVERAELKLQMDFAVIQVTKPDTTA